MNSYPTNHVVMNIVAKSQWKSITSKKGKVFYTAEAKTVGQYPIKIQLIVFNGAPADLDVDAEYIVTGRLSGANSGVAEIMPDHIYRVTQEPEAKDDENL